MLDSVDNEIDTTTGTMKLRATFPNTDEALFPNQFVNARLLVRTIAGATIAPVAAIQHGAPGTFVFLVKPDGTVAVQKVTTGVANGDRTQIVSGLKAGDVVVVDGADRLREGVEGSRFGRSGRCGCEFEQWTRRSARPATREYREDAARHARLPGGQQNSTPPSGSGSTNGP